MPMPLSVISIRRWTRPSSYRVSFGAEADRAAVRRVLDGVGEDVDQYLPDMQLAADEIGVPERADLLW